MPELCDAKEERSPEQFYQLTFVKIISLDSVPCLKSALVKVTSGTCSEAMLCSLHNRFSRMYIIEIKAR